MKRGQVYYIDLRQPVGSEQGGRRPCAIIQNNAGNESSPTIIIAPMTASGKKHLPTHVETTGEDKKLFIGSVILTEQIQTVDKSRVEEYVYNLSENTMRKVDEAICVSLALNKEREVKEMSELVHIGNSDISIKEYKGKRVVTFKDIDMVHERPEGTARKRFNDNKKHFIEDADFFKITPSEFRTAIGDMDLRQQNDVTLITESGYLMLVKSFTDDLAWQVQRQLVNAYFRKAERMSPEEMMRVQLGMIDEDRKQIQDHESRIENLENNTTLDYGQQRVLEETVNKTVISALGGKESNAYKKIGRKVFAECNRDLKSYFNVNARNNIPKRRFDEAVEYAKNWKPCTNTQMLINDYNAQMTL